jgi:glucose/arabinose dehydrogenase
MRQFRLYAVAESQNAGPQGSGLLQQEDIEVKNAWMMTATAVVLASVTASQGNAQVNAGMNPPTNPNPPFVMTPVTTFDYPWRMAFLPDGRMLVTEKVGRVDLVTQDGKKTVLRGTPPVFYQGQNGMLGVFLSPHFATDNFVYLTYVEPGEYGGGLVLARGTLNLGDGGPGIRGLQVLWRQLPKGMGGQDGAQIAFAPDGNSLFLTVGDRQRMTPAQDPNQPEGKIFHMTLDGKPAPDNPNYGKTGAATVPLIDPPADTEAAKTAPVVSTYTYTTPNLTPAYTWTMGHRTPYGLAFAPNGELWELEHGPRGGDDLNLIKKGGNYGWPLVRYAPNYDGVPVGDPKSRPDIIGAGDLLDAGDRAGQSDVLHGQQGLPAMERQWPDQRHGDHVHQPGGVRRPWRRQDRRPLGCGPSHPRYRGRPRRFAVGAGRRQSRHHVAHHAEIAAAPCDPGNPGSQGAFSGFGRAAGFRLRAAARHFKHTFGTIRPYPFDVHKPL